MPNPLDYIVRLGGESSLSDQFSAINHFSSEFNWNPIDKLRQVNLDSIGKTHLLVEHGLEHSAILTFVPEGIEFSNLTPGDQRRSLSISYNNLVDWQLYINPSSIYTVFNRTDPPQIVRREISENSTEALRSEAFQELLRDRRTPTQQALDDALIQTIRFWRINLSALLEGTSHSENISSLVNSIIFARALEDNQRYFRSADWREESSLLNFMRGSDEPIRFGIKKYLEEKLDGNVPNYVYNSDRLAVFDRLDHNLVLELISSFYGNRYAPYDYNFSLISKHALSRIYEKYVVLLKTEESAQTSFVLPLPVEQKRRVFGTVYTPQYIARFFARYLENVLPPSVFRQLRTIDPACGSGIFLRNLLELQTDPIKNNLDRSELMRIFENVYGYDIDENAVRASELSIALLYMTLTESVPDTLNISTQNSIEADWSRQTGTYDALIANPPYISSGRQDEATKRRIAELLGQGKSQSDLYVAFLKLAIDLIKPGGYGLLVLPHSFLVAKSASAVRDAILENCWIRLIADLSEIEVFSGVGVYVMLLIFQKKEVFEIPAPDATILKSKKDVGRALEDVLKSKIGSDDTYSIHNVTQSAFEKGKEWFILPATQSQLEMRLRAYPTLKDFMEIHIGFSTGNDDVFTLDAQRVPRGEQEVWVPYIPDRQIFAYSFDRSRIRYVFYPFDRDGEPLSLNRLKKLFPKTYTYLSTHKSILSKRFIVKEKPDGWWIPNRSRHPERMMIPKIITPHLAIIPRFAVDLTGEYAVSRSPLMYPKTGEGLDLLKYFLAVLNSSVGFWHISTHSHKYGSGYNMLEPKTLKETPVPDPEKIEQVLFAKVVKLVDHRLRLKREHDVFECEKEIDILVSQLYGLTNDEQKSLGLI